MALAVNGISRATALGIYQQKVARPLLKSDRQVAPTKRLAPSSIWIARSQGSRLFVRPQVKLYKPIRTWAFPTSLRGGAAVLATAVSPSLSKWIAPALICALSYALYNIFIKKASSSIDPILGGVLLQFVAALFGSILLISKRMLGQKSTLAMQSSGILWAVAAGVAVGAAEILSFLISSMGVQASQSIPIIIGGSVLLGTVLGSVFLREVLTVKGWCGVLLIAGGIALVGMDPGASLH